MLSNEDNLRLNVLVAQTVKAIRINESSMVLTALTERGEATISLNPNSKHDAYLRDVRDFLSEKYLGMPGGFPRHITRWSRMGENKHSQDKLLLLGESEAIIALAYSHCLSEAHANYAWWAYQSPEIARNLLKSPVVIRSCLGKELAQFLLEFLPFEERPLDVVEGVKLVLQGDLISEDEKLALWKRAQRKNPYFIGFMLAGARAIPLDENAHPNYAALKTHITQNLKHADDNPYAQMLLHFLSSDGRKWLKSLSLALKKPTEQDVVTAIFITLDQAINLSITPRRGAEDINDALSLAQSWCEQHITDAPKAVSELLALLNETQKPQLQALIVLAQLGENTLNSVFAGRDFSGSVMRKHLLPISTLINAQIDTLLKT